MSTHENKQDLEELEALNLKYLSSDQNSDVATYETFLHPRFRASLQDKQLYDRKAFLDMIGKPRPFTNLEHQDLEIDLFGNVALVRAKFSFRTLGGEKRDGRYTDEYQKVDGKWMCIGANVQGDLP